MIPNDADVRTLEQTAVAPPATLGTLAHQLELSPRDVAVAVRGLLLNGALALATTSDHAQLAVVVGRTEAVEPFAEDRPVLRGWLTVRQGRGGDGTQPLGSAGEFANVAAGFAQRTRQMVVIVPRCTTGDVDEQVGRCQEAMRAACAQRITPKLVVPKQAYALEQVRALCQSMAEMGVLARIVPEIDTPLIAWQGLGAAYLLPERTLLGVTDVYDYASACHEAGDAIDVISSSQVARLLAEGLTDAVAARRLGMSERQFRRHVSQLQSDLGCTSRFQAGVLAARVLQW